MSNDDSFNSIERLMEFGLSMAIAQQMMQTMNHAIQNMTTPGQQMARPLVPPVIQYFALVNEIPQGPFSEDEFKGHILGKRVHPDTLIWMSGMDGWKQASSVPTVAPYFVTD